MRGHSASTVDVKIGRLLCGAPCCQTKQHHHHSRPRDDSRPQSRGSVRSVERDKKDSRNAVTAPDSLTNFEPTFCCSRHGLYTALKTASACPHRRWYPSNHAPLSFPILHRLTCLLLLSAASALVLSSNFYSTASQLQIPTPTVFLKSHLASNFFYCICATVS